MTDEQIIERCKAAGIKWIPPQEDEDDSGAFPGSFDMVSMDEMRALLAAGASEGQTPCATLHDDGYWTWKGTAPYESRFAGWRMNVFADPSAEIAALRERIAGMEKEAERYRWLARKVSAHGVIDGWAFGFPSHLTLAAPPSAMRDPENALGETIDAAIAKEKS